MPMVHRLFILYGDQIVCETWSLGVPTDEAAERMLVTAQQLFHVRPHDLEMVDEPAMACRACGCTDDHACPGGCSWIEPDLCSACAGPRIIR